MKILAGGDAETQSADIIGDNIEALKIIFPDAFVEGKIDFDVLRQLLGGAVEEHQEKYGLNWHGKRRARQMALTPSIGTLRPCPEESVDWDTTQNLMIEGDNLEVLKLLQKSYSGKVKLIYIDPPYNTGKDFVYPDNFQDNIRNYLEMTSQVDDDQKLSSNTDSSGRFHTDWLNMMFPRLKLARALLKEDGLILISIDEHENASLHHLLVEIFGEENSIGTIVWKGATDNNPTQIAIEHEYLVCFGRSKEAARGEWKNSSDDAKLTLLGQYERLKQDPSRSVEEVQKELRSFIKANREALAAITHYDRVDVQGVYTGSRKVHNPKPGGYVYDVYHPVTKRVCAPPVNGYRYPKVRMDELIAADKILYGENESQIIQIKEYLDDYDGKLSSVIQLDSRAGANELNDLLGVQKLFSNPKPVPLLKEIFEFLLDKDDLTLDFFAGSGTTAHSLWRLNAADNGRRRFILVQLPEPLLPSNRDQKVAADFCDKIGCRKNIAELTKERLRRASTTIRNESALFAGDLGFRVFKLDSSNIRTWDPDRTDLGQSLLDSLDHLKPDRTEQDVLYELLLKLGLDLCVPMETRSIAGKDVHAIGGGVLMACLAESIRREEVERLAHGIVEWHEVLKPEGDVTCVFRDSAFADDVAKTNLTAILAQRGIENVRSL